MAEVRENERKYYKCKINKTEREKERKRKKREKEEEKRNGRKMTDRQTDGQDK